MKKEYNIGLDIGTDSVGWAVVDKNTNEVFYKDNVNLWGVRLFEEAQKAESRRTARSTRRRFDRRRKRIKLLQNEFNDEMNKVDSNFFKKMRESFYNKNDKEHKTIPITKEEKELIINYNLKYPTIYHLRDELINNPNKQDIRLVYLAIHHIIKYRGNFLYNNPSFNASNLDVKSKLNEVFNNMISCEELSLSDDSFSDLDFNALENSLLLKSKQDKKVAIKSLLSKYFDNKTTVTELQKLFNGNKFNINKLLNLSDDEYNKIEIDFSGSAYDDNMSDIEETYGDKSEIISELKKLYDMVFLKDMFTGTDAHSLSTFMVSRYNKHKEDLELLKSILMYDKQEYAKFFKPVRKEAIYSKYIHNQITNDELVKEINKSLEIVLKCDVSKDLLDKYNSKKKEIENGYFLPRVTDQLNGKFPYQFNKDELIKIIENQGKYYPFLLNKIDNTYKLVKLLEFRIPYYVGPLNNTTSIKGVNNKNSWVCKNDNKAVITPYNFDEVIDKDKSAEEFIKRMISHCTYILKEYAMPNNAILYSEYKVRNELKQITYTINNKSSILPLDLQERIYQNLFLKTNGTITDKIFRNYLRTDSDGQMIYDSEIKGYSAEGKFANNMKPYIDFFGPEGIFKDTNYNIDAAEKIIEYITIFEDKDILRRKVAKEYPNLNEIALNKIVNKKYTGWSSLSKKLLTDIYYKDDRSGINKSIMDLMRETKDNFMQIITNKKYNFQGKIDELNDLSNVSKLTYDVVDPLATSPSNKRGIYQALKIVEELVKYIGYEPSNISIEMARSNDEKKRTSSRYKYLNDLYNNSKSSIYDYNILKGKLDKYKDNDEPLRDEKLFLYFIQEGKSLYSMEPLNIENFGDYEVDHIIPRTLVKDDSIDNKALVLKKENQIKAASYVLPEQFRTGKMFGFWNHLKECGLITDKKIRRLSRSYYSEDDIKGFINRQIVETRQICKHVANILNNFYKDTNIIYLKADVSHQYRAKFDLFKFRDLNDYHHAHDAYLAAVLGEYTTNWFKDNVSIDELKVLNKKYYDNKEYEKQKYGYYVNSLDPEFQEYVVKKDTGEVFDISKFNKLVENTLYRNDILVTKKTEIRTGELFQQTKNSKGGKGVPLKKGLDTSLYGAYTSLNPSYAVVVKYTKNGQEQGNRMVGMPTYIDAQYKNNTVREDYIKKILNLKDNDSVDIVVDKIPFNTLLDWDGQICSLVGATDTVEVCNAKEFRIKKEKMKEWKYTLNKLLNKSTRTIDEVVYNRNLNEIVKYIVDSVGKEYKLYSNLVPQMKEMFKYDNIDELSVTDKENIIIQMLGLLKRNSTNANLKCLNDDNSKEFGRKKGKTISHAVIINTSVTGIKKNRYEF